MKLLTITTTSNIFTDENLSNDNLMNIANKGIARINAQLGTKFPFYENVNAEYLAFPDTWQLSLLSNFVSYGVKMNDSSLNEADRYLDEFYKLLELFEGELVGLVENYENGNTSNGISPEYIETEGFGGIYGLETETAVLNNSHFDYYGNGGCF